ncbi:hypothetical protein T4B_5803 [Trichinella pseudospiralis]|uniref:Uncharacterized protein n=1 Tax=Trichinella pseudospiralis TaxID=6337 RepID=A0A0V1JXG5_TRIPS|nr:hypothetical protein T4B_5803 [Trichinella pseudospiralis]KRZ39668.1 hypothetical protein T4C_5017 [Trichinella pseudospiralis]
MHFTPASKHYQSMTISSDSCNMALLIMSRGYTSLLKLKVCYGNHLQKKFLRLAFFFKQTHLINEKPMVLFC